MRTVCEICPIRTVCNFYGRPKDIKLATPAQYNFCVIFTCPDGERAAGRAISNGKPDKYLDLQRRKALFRFGTRNKPTHKTKFGPHRWTDSDGNVYVAFSRTDYPQSTGQNIYSDLV